MPLNSMTGYGQTLVEQQNYKIEVQLKSVNGKSLKINYRLPELFTLDDERKIEKEVGKNIARGSVQLRAYFKQGVAFVCPSLNVEVLKNYQEQLSQGFPDEKVPVLRLLNLPGISIEPAPEESLLQSVRESLFKALKGAVAELIESREQEGKALASELKTILNKMQTLWEKIRDRAKILPQKYRERLSERLSEILEKQNVELKKEDLIRECAFYVDRSDIQEEVVRFREHLNALEKILNASDNKPVGRKLEFIGQEMHREANTMGSKSIDSELSSLVIELKTEIDRLKEQVLNVE